MKMQYHALIESPYNLAPLLAFLPRAPKTQVGERGTPKMSQSGLLIYGITHMYVGMYVYMYVIIGVRDQFRLGGLRSVARIFSQLLARKSSGFAQILPDFFARIWLFSNFQGGLQPPSPPPPPPPASYAYVCMYV